MTGVLLVNMGGAESPEEMKTFLSRMFKDPYILPFGKTGRNLLAFIISTTRHKKSWKKYQLIGGTPIIKATEKSKQLLQGSLGSDYQVEMAFSYSQPLISESLYNFIDKGIKDIVIVPLYPQSSFSTRVSVESDVKKVSEKENLNIRFVKEFYQKELYIEFWANLISDHIKEKNYKKPLLLFSAHSIPEYMVDKGDTYPRAILESATLISNHMELDFDVVYQSGMSGKWIGPDVNDRLKEMATEGKEEIIIIPISFVNENLETLYDIDKIIVPFASNKLGIKSISRVRIPEGDENFIKLLNHLIVN